MRMNQKSIVKVFLKCTKLMALGVYAILLISCTHEIKDKPRPNILWLYVEDISPNLGCYGDSVVQTPNIDQLAEQGVRFANTIMPAPVCSAMRSAMITGMMQTTLGTHNHHSSRTETSQIYLPDSIKTIPEHFKEAGYFTFNQGKDDYNFSYVRDSLYSGDYHDNGMYGLVGDKIDWQLKEKDQPYFGQIQFYGNKYIYNKKFDEIVLREIDTAAIKLPSYYPETSWMKEEWADYLSSIELTDQAVGETLQDLKNQGLLENTYVFFFSDHGMRLWRHKQFLYEGGIKVPLTITYFGENGKIQPATLNKDLISGLDISATSLGLAGIALPDYLEGQDFLSNQYARREYVISARDRCDFSIDRVRSVRTEKFKYIRNFMTDRPYMQPSYRDAWDVTQHMKKAYENGELNEVQARVWQDQRPDEELYDLINDPDELVNLADEVAFKKILKTHREILDQWISNTNDQGQYPEDIEGLKFMYEIWGNQCINPEYNKVKALIAEN